MKTSYKVALIATALLCAAIIGYYLVQEPGEVRVNRPVIPDASASRLSPTGVVRPTLRTLASPSADLTAAAPSALPQPLAEQPSSVAAPATPTSTPPPASSTVTFASRPAPATASPPAGLASPTPTGMTSAPPSSLAPRPSLAVAPATQPTTMPSAGWQVTTRPPVSAAADQPRSYTIKANDTFQSIAVTIYGSHDYADDIAYENPTVDPRKLKIGQVIRLPSLKQIDQQRQTAPSSATDAQQTVYVTRASDTLWSIAVQFYGDGTQWQRIYRENRDRIGPNPDSLEEGLKLHIPPKPAAPSR